MGKYRSHRSPMTEGAHMAQELLVLLPCSHRAHTPGPWLVGEADRPLQKSAACTLAHSWCPDQEEAPHTVY